MLLVRVPKRGGGAAIRTDRNQPEATYNTRQFGGWIEVRDAAIRTDRDQPEATYSMYNTRQFGGWIKVRDAAIITYNTRQFGGWIEVHHTG